MIPIIASIFSTTLLTLAKLILCTQLCKCFESCEFPEFSRQVLEVMRQPLEDGHISIARARYSIDYPAGFMLVASMNPCPCGYYNHPSKECTCPPGAVTKYLGRISGPLMDRIDLQVEIMPVPFEELSSAAPGESSETIRARVIKARAIQSHRYKGIAGVHCNAQMTSRLLERYCRLDEECMRVLETAMKRFDMSARAYDRIRKVARTIADIDYSSSLPVEEAAVAPILVHHMAEAISYRNLDRSTWGASTDFPASRH